MCWFLLHPTHARYSFHVPSRDANEARTLEAEAEARTLEAEARTFEAKPRLNNFGLQNSTNFECE